MYSIVKLSCQLRK